MCTNHLSFAWRQQWRNNGGKFWRLQLFRQLGQHWGSEQVPWKQSQHADQGLHLLIPRDGGLELKLVAGEIGCVQSSCAAGELNSWTSRAGTEGPDRCWGASRCRSCVWPRTVVKPCLAHGSCTMAWCTQKHRGQRAPALLRSERWKQQSTRVMGRSREPEWIQSWAMPHRRVQCRGHSTPCPDPLLHSCCVLYSLSSCWLHIQTLRCSRFLPLKCSSVFQPSGSWGCYLTPMSAMSVPYLLLPFLLHRLHSLWILDISWTLDMHYD